MDLIYPYALKMVAANDIGAPEEPLHGDIYDDLSALAREHPNCRVTFGFCVVDTRTNLIPDGFDDWYDTPEEAYAAYGMAVIQEQI